MNAGAVVCICGDPGGANAVAPVVRTIESDAQWRVASYVYNEAADVFARHGFEARPVPPASDAVWALERLRQHRAAAVLAGTSHNARNCEHLFIHAARRLGIPTIAVLDFWSNYRERFPVTGDLACLPDAIAIMDERAREQMSSAGFPPERLHVTGQPAFDALGRVRASFGPDERSALRRHFGVGALDRLVLFASQPLSKLYGPNTAERPNALGYDQFDVLPVVIRALERANERSAQSIVLVVRPHPRESAADYERFRSDRVNVRVSTDGDSRACAMASDLVVGMNTALLVEACYLGCAVVSVQPGLRTADALPTNEWGASIAVYRREDVAEIIERLLLDDGARAAALTRVRELRLDGGAARRVADLLYARAAQAGPVFHCESR
jgi:hypothetical protein